MTWKVRYTTQRHADSGNWAHPDGRQSLAPCANRSEVCDILRDWADEVGRLNDERDAYLYVWRGRLSDVTDQYPDFRVSIGPRGGLHWEPC
jgi:hypothetical protein